MFRKVADFIEMWKGESKTTTGLLSALTDASLSQAVGPEDRTIGRMAWHIATAIPEMMGRTGLVYDGLSHDAPMPATAAEVRDAYAAAAEWLADAVAKNWTDETLDVIDDMYGMKWPRGTTLGVLIAHEVHHRGQMSVLMRQAGVKPTMMYGPTREAWAGMGMQAPAV